MKRKIVQIASLTNDVGIVALADDGSLWIGYESMHSILGDNGNVIYDTKFEWTTVAGLPDDISSLTKVKG